LPMIEGIEHIGIAVKDLDAAEKKFEALLGIAPYKREEVASEHVLTSFFLVGQTKIELLAATSPESAIAKFIDKKGEGIHHLAFRTNNVQSELNRVSAEGFELIHQQPKDGADDMEIAFLHPKSTLGMLTEFCAPKKG
jgi:methylmalonyl-CoA/ethylmalonyl-CoA epimerase